LSAAFVLSQPLPYCYTRPKDGAMEESFFPLSAAFGFSLQSQKKQKEHLPPRSFRCLVSQSLPDARRKKAHDIQPKERMSMFFLLSGVLET